jgi:ATP-binding cassette subfamily F protein uup
MSQVSLKGRGLTRQRPRTEKLIHRRDDMGLIWINEVSVIRGDKVGIIGPNGSGKTTLLKILLGELDPQQGRVRLGTGIRVAYFDQLRAQLDENGTLKDNIADGNDMVVVGGVSRHVMSYLQDFLFPPDRILSPVSSLSGGERNRLLLAILLILPSNVLVLDEPTNDLDTETLELLEDRLLEYSGTILMVSHDRAFLNNMVTSTIVFEGNGRLQEYVGGYDDWLRQRTERDESLNTAPREQKQKKGKTPREKQKLSYKDTRELEAVPLKIEALEEEKRRLLETLNSPAFYVNRDADEINRANDRLKALEEELEGDYGRWDELESLASKFSGEPG